MSFSNRLLLAAGVLLGWASLALAQNGPSHVIVTYRVQPDKRPSFRSTLPNTMGQLARWRDNGTVAGFIMLTNAFIDDEGWESMAIVQLGSRGLELGRRLDPPDAATFAAMASMTTVPADLIETASGDGEAPGTGVYLVVPYESAGNPDDFRMWARQYLVQLLNASMKEGGLIGYQIFQARYPAGRSQNALAVLHYADWAGLGQREAVAAKVIAADAASPTWSFYSKPGQWRERVAVVAEPAGPK